MYLYIQMKMGFNTTGNSSTSRRTAQAVNLGYLRTYADNRGDKKIGEFRAAVHNLTSASASIPTVRGEAGVKWNRTGSALTLDVTVPANSRAKIFIPADSTATLREGEVVC